MPFMFKIWQICFIITIENFLGLASPFFTVQIYDRVLASHSIPTLQTLFILLVIALIAQSGLAAVRSRALVRLGGRFEAVFDQSAARESIVRMSDGALSRQPRPLKEVERVRSFFASGDLKALVDAPWIVIYAIVLWLLHPLLGAVAIAGVAVVAVLNLVATRFQAAAEQVDELAPATSLELDRDKTAHTVATGQSNRIADRWAGRKQQRRITFRSAWDRSEIARSASRFVKAALQAGLLATAAYLTLEDLATAGVMMASAILLSRLLNPAEAIVSKWKSIRQAAKAYRSLVEIERAQTRLVRGQRELTKPSGSLRMSRVSIDFTQTSTAICRDLVLHLDPGDALAIVGPSSSGKTSVIRAAIGAVPASSGLVTWDGADMTKITPHSRLINIAYLPQPGLLHRGSVAQNIASFASRTDMDRVVDIATRLGAHDHILRLQKGYETEVGSESTYLSSGLAQKIALARALYGTAGLIALDEPTAHLDREAEAALNELLAERRAKGSIVLIAAPTPTLLATVSHMLKLNGDTSFEFKPRDHELKANVAKLHSILKPDGGFNALEVGA